MGVNGGRVDQNSRYQHDLTVKILKSHCLWQDNACVEVRINYASTNFSSDGLPYSYIAN